jgi:tRNA dimethylallyltransferase
LACQQAYNYLMKKILVVCGPTATGKTGLGLKLAKKFNGEIISADSRQIYKGMDIATGKDINQGKWVKDHWEIEGIPLWLLDIVEPNVEFSVAHYADLAWEKIKDIWQRGKLPVIVGGTGFYIKAVLENIPSQGIPPNWPLREKLELKSVESLFEELAKLDSFRAGQMNTSDRQNKRRLIRAIEIARWRVANLLPEDQKLPVFETLFIGLKTSSQILYRRIDKRVEERYKMGVKKEISGLLMKGFSWNLPSMSAMGYQEWRPFFEKKADLLQVLTRWKFNEHAYARRQMTWFKKEKQIHWFDISQRGWENRVEKEVFIWYIKDNAKQN